MGRKVYVRYDPDDLQEVRVYDDQDRFLCTAQQTEALSYFADKEELAEHIRENRKYMRAVQAWKDMNVKKPMSELELLMWQAENNMSGDASRPDPRLVRIHALDEKAVGQMPKVAGFGGDEPIDYTEAVERLRDAQEC